MVKTVKLLRPLGSLRVLASGSRSYYDLFDAVVRLAVRRATSTEIKCELLSANDRSLLKIDFVPPLAENEFQMLVTNADPALFARGNLTYVLADSIAVQADGTFIHPGDPKSLELPVNHVSLPDDIGTISGSLLIHAVDPTDVVTWETIEEYQLLEKTALGNRRSPRVNLELVHVGQPRRIEPVWELTKFLEAHSIDDDLTIRPAFKREMELPTTNMTARVAFGIAFGSNNRRIRIYDSNRVYLDLQEPVRLLMNSNLNKILPPRLINRSASYLEIDFSEGLEVGPLGELPSHLVKDVRGGLGSFFSELEQWHEFKQLLDRADRWAIAEEGMRLQQRKERARWSRSVHLAKDGKEIRLYREPQNEQDVVLLTSMLAQHGFFFVL